MTYGYLGGPRPDPAGHQGAEHAHRQAADAPGGGRAGGRPCDGPRGAEHHPAQRLSVAGGRAGRDRHHVQRGHGHRPERTEADRQGGLCDRHGGRAGAAGHGHRADVHLQHRRAGHARQQIPAGPVPGRRAHRHFGEHHRGDPERAGQAVHKGGQRHSGRRPHRRRAGPCLPDRGHQHGRRGCEHRAGAGQDPAVLPVRGRAGRRGQQGAELVRDQGAQPRPAPLSDPGLRALPFHGLGR